MGSRPLQVTWLECPFHCRLTCVGVSRLSSEEKMSLRDAASLSPRAKSGRQGYLRRDLLSTEPWLSQPDTAGQAGYWRRWKSVIVSQRQTEVPEDVPGTVCDFCVSLYLLTLSADSSGQVYSVLWRTFWGRYRLRGSSPSAIHHFPKLELLGVNFFGLTFLRSHLRIGRGPRCRL
jgi:hypothetical protein